MIREILFDIYDFIRMTDSPVADIFLFVFFLCISCGVANSDMNTPLWKRILRILAGLGLFIFCWSYAKHGYAAIVS